MSVTAAIWEGAAHLREALVPIETVRTHPQNPRRGDVAEIAKSLSRFGQVRAILVDAEGTIVAGNHTYLAAVELGWTHVAVVTNDFASAEEARAYLLADNRLSDIGEYDRAELGLFLEDLERTGRWEGTGYTVDDLAQLRDLGRLADPTPPPEYEHVPPPQFREVVLLLTEDQLATFSGNLRAVRERFGLEGVTETVLRAVREESLRLNQGDGDG